MIPVAALILAIGAVFASPAWANAWNEPAQVLGLSWGASVEAVRQHFPKGKFWEDTSLTAAYSTSTTIADIPVSAVFQFVSQRGLQGLTLRFPASRLAKIAARFEQEYGPAPSRGNAQWRWEGTGVRISLGAYPALGVPPERSSGQNGVAWLRTSTLEEALARAEAPPRRAKQPTPPAAQRASYEERILDKIYWHLRYPTTAAGIYLVSLAFDLTAAGQPAGLELAVDPPNPVVAESVRDAISRAQPFPLPPSGIKDRRVTLTLTVSVFP